LRGERYIFGDIVQRLYSDDGRGDGHVTLSGLHTLQALIGAMNVTRGDDQIDLKIEVTSMAPLIASRAELMGEYDRLMDQEEANMRLPARQIDVNSVDAQIVALRKSSVERIRYAILATLFPSVGYGQVVCERFLGRRDGTLVGIALELYRRRHGKYPASLSELTPQLLPRIPADRITGDPLRYRLIDGKPVVYSVGADRVDDGGRGPDAHGRLNPAMVGWWGNEPATTPKGDWLLFAPEPSDEGDK
jgi:hypothetical protein